MKLKSESSADLVEVDCASRERKLENAKCTEINPKEEQQTVEKMVSFLQMYRYAKRWDTCMIFVGVICGIGGGTLQASQAIFVTATFVENAMVFLVRTGNSTTSQTQKDEAANLFTVKLRDFAIYNSLVGFAIFILVYISTVLLTYSTIRQISRIRLLYFKSMLNQDISWYDLHPTGGFASRMSEDVSKLRDAMGEKLSVFLYASSALTSSIVLSFSVGWKLTLVCFVPLIVIAFVIRGVTMLTSKFAKKEVDAYAAAGAIAEEVLTIIRTVVAFGGQQKEAARYSKKLEVAKKNSVKRSLLAGICSTAVWICIYSGYAFGFWYGIRLVIEEEGLPQRERVYDTVNIITIFTFVLQASLSFGYTSAFIEIFAGAKASATRIFSIIDSAPVINQSKNNGKVLGSVKGEIAFKNVHFNYPSRPDTTVLQGLNLIVKAGEKVALVGSSGCGKSTCIQLMQRFYDPISGQIYLDGNDIYELNLTWMRSNIGVVGQEPILFNTTVAENIKYGNLSATQEAIEEAAERANAHSFISLLPQGYETLVGERGIHLSGGEKQRIAIARALVRRPSILLLDEATSALDAKSQAEVQATLDQISEGCTTIIVAHRLSTIRGADKIVVLSEGKVVEEGTHQTLMKRQGTYYNLVTAPISESDSLESGDNDNCTVHKTDDKILSSMPDNTDVDDLLEDEKSGQSSFCAILKQNGPKWWVILMACMSLILMSCNLPLFAVIQGDIIGILANQDHDYMVSQISKYVIFLVCTGIATGFAAFFQTCIFSVTGTKFTLRLRRQMFPAMLRQEIGWFDDRKNGVGALCTRLSGEPATIQAATGQAMEVIVRSITTLALSVGLSMFYEWRLTLAALVFAPFIFLAFFCQRKFLHGQHLGQSGALEDSIRVSVEAVGNIRTVASLGCEETFIKSYKSALLMYDATSKRSVHVTAGIFGLSRGLMFFSSSICMYYGGILVRDENLEIEKVFKVVQSITKSTTNLATGIAFTTNLHQAIISATKIFKLLSRTPNIVDRPDSKSVKWVPNNLKYSQVDFAYPTRPQALVLKNFDFSVLQGQTVALVGPSGCGKSTVLQLLERFYDPTSGEIVVDGENIKKMKLESLRAALGIVSQEPNLFNKTITENIAYGDNNRLVSMEEVMEAAKISNIHNFIISLPLGYDTKLGERGTQLSGGQKQRIAIARALIRNPMVLLLDEATSALDSEGEKVVQEALNNARKGRTCITIAHRLTTIQDADIICVVNNGSVTEMGTHSQLLIKKGLYYKLYNISESVGK